MAWKFLNVSDISEELIGDPSKIRSNKPSKEQKKLLQWCVEAIQEVIDIFKENKS